jgi:hypothetical protein
MNKTTRKAWGIGSATIFALSALTLSGCEFDVVNPGVISEDALNGDDAIGMVLNGLIGDLEEAFGDLALHSALASDELSFSGTRSWLFNAGKGDLRPEDGSYVYHDLATSTWTAVTGVERLTNLGASTDEIATANLYAGFIHRIMGENYCAYVFDGGEMLDGTEWFNKALSYFQAAANGSGNIGVAAKAGQAQVLVALGRYTDAAALAAQVPDDFSWFAHYTDLDTSNLWEETQNQTQATVWHTPIEALGEGGDPRTPWEDEERNGAGGDPFFRQDKYKNRSDDHPLARGWEMRLIEAEASLRQGQWSDALAGINYVRGAFTLPDATAGNEAETWDALSHERLVLMWLEGRHLYDLYRLDDPFLTGRDYCFPFADSEINSNPNLAGCTGPACS